MKKWEKILLFLKIKTNTRIERMYMQHSEHTSATITPLHLFCCYSIRWLTPRLLGWCELYCRAIVANAATLANNDWGTGHSSCQFLFLHPIVHYIHNCALHTLTVPTYTNSTQYCPSHGSLMLSAFAEENVWWILNYSIDWMEIRVWLHWRMKLLNIIHRLVCSIQSKYYYSWFAVIYVCMASTNS